MSRRTAARRDRSNDDDDGGLSTGGKVAIGVAVAAAAGAAIGYFGSRLLSSWLSESDEKDEKNDKDKKSAWKDFDYDDWKMSPESERDTAKDAGYVPGATASNRNTEPGGMSKQLSLHEQLSHYYSQYVNIPAAQMQAALQAVAKLTTIVGSHLRKPSSLKAADMKVGDLVSFGSTTEGLEVVRPDHFDVMVPIMFSCECHTQQAAVAGRKLPGYCEIVISSSADDNPFCDAQQKLVTSRVLDTMAEVIARSADASSQYACTVRPPTASSCAVQLDVYTGSSNSITINFVPFVIIESHLFLPVSPAVAPGNDQPVCGLWTEAYIRQEKWSIDRFDSSVSGHITVMKILKAIRLNHRDQFGAVSSYHLKMLLLHVLEDLPDSCDWDSNAIGERLIDLLTTLRDRLSDHCMPHYFDQTVNTLEDVPIETCTNLAKFLDRKLALNDISSLLRKDY